ncbi:MAG: putative ABC transporter-binding protein precursor [candidate division TA06 bacterium ADurb.Bin417]|uniref:Putative ABC transporter-binding protein n=1 Tax=candidate division TA06 bacterium ADurb.Bin417 TaxID=1852828 RepID=A0A1V5M8X5_UNCT6|nr:MAG: putative ABC transporter-binding protein precursor [candidate division TA06 bacterium ADurb.Bin417]
MEFTLLTNGDNQQRVQTSTIIMDDLARLGIKVHFLPVDFNNLVTRLNTSFEWETVLIGFTGTIDPHGGRNVWHSSGQLHVWNPRQPKPRTVWEREIDDLFERGAVEMDPGRRKAIYDRWQEVAAEEQPLIFTVNPAALYAVRNRFGNLKPTIYGVFHNLEAIYTLD